MAWLGASIRRTALCDGSREGRSCRVLLMSDPYRPLPEQPESPRKVGPIEAAADAVVADHVHEQARQREADLPAPCRIRITRRRE